MLDQILRQKTDDLRSGKQMRNIYIFTNFASREASIGLLSIQVYVFIVYVSRKIFEYAIYHLYDYI